MVRYNPWPKHNTETVAAHSYYTALFTMLLCDELKVSSQVKAAALKIALLHDLPESITNDITHDAKKEMPEVCQCLDEYEKKYFKKHFPKQYDEMYDESFEDYRIARAIVKAADILSVIQYCDNEVQLGNKAFEPLLEDAHERFKNEKEKLERLGLKCQKIII